MKYSDEKLITNYLKGDEKSLEVLIKRYLKPVYGFVCHYVRDYQEAEDITQEVFVKAWRNLKKFDKSKNFKSWIFKIAKNSCLDALKKKKTIPFSEFENEMGKNMLLETLSDTAPLPNKVFEQAETNKLLNSAIEKLSPKYSQVLFLKHNGNLTFQEITDILKEPINTIKSRYRRALLQLQKILLEP